jgi:hypothetical protein
MYPNSVFLVLPTQFAIASESAQDNRYMQLGRVDAALAERQCLGLATALRAAGHSVLMFPGLDDAPDGVFPNNVFATRPGHFVIGAMRHAVRQRETQRADLRRFFSQTLRYQCHDLTGLTAEQHYAELTGCLVIDRHRGVGFCGLSERCSERGAQAMQHAFALAHMRQFRLHSSEYHTNVVMSALGGKGVMLAASGFADHADALRIASVYDPNSVIWISAEEKANFVANCIALSDQQLWMSTRAMQALSTATRHAIAALGFVIHHVDLSELEKAGGSLRCMIGEIY